MVAGVELEANATDHTLSNQQSENQSFPHITRSWITANAGAYLQLYRFIFVLCKLFTLDHFLDHGSWLLFQSCNSCATTFTVEIWAQLGQRTSTPWKNICCILLLQLHSGTCAIHKTTMVASNTSTTITA